MMLDKVEPVFWAYCSQCGRCYEVRATNLTDPAGSLPLSDESFSCITPLCGGRLRKYRRDSIAGQLERILTACRVVVPISQDDFYRAVMGLDIKPVTLDRLAKATANRRIVEWKCLPDGNGQRVIVETLILEDGTRVHLAPSVKGACVYRIEEPDERPGS